MKPLDINFSGVIIGCVGVFIGFWTLAALGVYSKSVMHDMCGLFIGYVLWRLFCEVTYSMRKQKVEKHFDEMQAKLIRSERETQKLLIEQNEYLSILAQEASKI